MNQSKKYGVIGILIPVIFGTTYFVMSSVRPEYSHFTKAVSELGSLDAPDKWWWNGIGYITIGLLISVFAVGLRKSVNPNGGGKLAFWGLLLSGFFMALAGVFPGDFNDRESATMLMHTIGSLGSFFFFVIAAFSYPKQFKKSVYWKAAIIPSLVFTVLCILSGFIRTDDAPGISQRIGFGFYFLWIAYLGYMLIKMRSEKIEP